MVKRGKQASADAAGKRDASASGGRSAPEETANGTSGYSTPIGDAERLKILDAILENMNEGLFLIDEDFKYVLINPSSGRILSHDPKQWIGKRAGGYVHPDDQVRSHEAVMRTIQGENTSCEVRIMGSDGKYRNLEMHYSLITVGDTFYVLGLVEDITKRKRLEDEMRASEEKYKLLANTPSIAMFTLDLRGSFIFVNSTFQNVFGYSADESHNINFFTVIHEDDIDRAHRQISLVSRGKGMHNVEYRVHTKCGEYLPVLVSASPIQDKNGKVISILCVANDIADLKATEGELAKYREHLEELVEKRTAKLKEEMAERQKANEELKSIKERLDYVLGATRTGFDIIDSDRNLVYVDPSWAKTLGDYGGKKCYEYFMGSKQPCDTCAIPQALKTKKTIISEEYLKKEDRYIEVHTIPFKSENGDWLVAEFNLDITDRKIAERELKESEEKYRTLFNQASDGIMFMAVDGSRQMVNESFARMHGYSGPAEMERIGLGDLDTPESAKLAPERMRRMIDGETLNFEVEHLHKDGHIITLEVHCSVINIGEISFFLGFHQDITSRKNAESALIESEKKFRELADNSPSMIFINRMGKVVYANRKCSEVMGYAPDEFLGDGFDFLSLVAPEDRKRVQENARRRFEGVESAPYEYTLLTKEKKRFDVLINSKPINYGGEPAILGIITDISQLKRATAELAESEDTQKNILKMMPDAVVISDLTGKITYVSEKALVLGGHSSVEEVSGTNFIELIAPEDHERAFDDLGRLLKSEAHMVTHYKLLRKDGSSYDGEISTTLLKSGMGKVRAILGIIRDVTDSKKMEETLRESEEKYRNLVERAQDGIVIAQNGKPVFFNDRALTMTGYSSENAYTSSIMDAIADEEKAMVADMYARRMRGEPVPSIYETKLKRPDGTTLPVEVNAGVIQYLGKPADMLVIRDLSERTKAAVALSENELKYRTLFDSANDAIFVADALTGALIEANKKAEELTGLTRKEIIGMHQANLHPPEDVDRYIEMFKAHLEDGAAIAGDVFVLRKDGSRVPVMISSRSFLLDGKLVNQGTFHDLTERVEYEKSIRESEEKYRKLFDLALDAIFLMDGNIFVDCNNKTLDMFKCTRDEIIGQPPYRFSPPSQPDGISSDEKAKELIQGAYAGKPQFFEWTHTRIDDTSFDAEVSLNLIDFKEKKYLLAIVRDITERKKNQMETIQLKEFSENIIDKSPVGIMTSDMAGNITLVNRAMLGILGSPGADKTMKFNILKLKPMVEQGVSKLFEDCLATGKKASIDKIHYKTMWGKDLDVSIQIVPLMDTIGGKQIGSLALVEDISEKVKVGRELAASEAKLHNIMESMDDMVFGFDTEGRFNFYHSPDKGNLYASPEMFVGKLHSEVLPPHVSVTTAEALARAKNGKVTEYEYWLEIGGAEKWFLAKVSPLIEDGHYKGAVAVIRDVTEKKAAEEKLRNSEEQLKALFHASIDGIGVEKGGRFAYVNPSFASIHGYPTPEALYGASVGGLTAPDDRERMSEYSNRRLSGMHAPNRYQYKAMRKDGSSFDAEISISQYLLNHELYIVGFVKDVTESKKRQAEDVHRQVLEAQLKLKSVLTDIVPAMLGSMGKEARADLVEKLSERLDIVLAEKYPDGITPDTTHDVSDAYIAVLTDLGGKAVLTHRDDASGGHKEPSAPRCSVTINACPWDNQKGRNLLLCVLCRGIAWRFAARSKRPIDVHLKKTMADSEKSCLVEIEEEKD